MPARIVVLWGINMYGLVPKTGEFVTDWPTTGYDIGLPNPADATAAGKYSVEAVFVAATKVVGPFSLTAGGSATNDIAFP